ncbi:MAG TPA: VWA domain-containing protein, partial [Vicinamibacterales bacterium]|nr:VWA domain-containing protein [Vicinamibacterales bacterium]
MRGALAIVFVASLLTQPPTPGAAQQPPTFASGTQVVQVDARVFDKSGHFVTGLAPADFEIKEDGASQRIVSLVFVNPAAHASDAPASVAPETSTAPAAAAPAPPPGAVAPNLWIFVFDTGHLSQGGLERTRKAVAQFLQDTFLEGDVGGIVADGKMANNRLTSNRVELVKAANDVKLPDSTFRYQVAMTREWPKIQDEFEAWRIAAQNDSAALQQAVIRACTEDPDACKRSPPDGVIRNKAQAIMTEAHAATAIALRSVEALSNGLARMPGPKTVVFLSEGFILLDMADALKDATGLANRAGAHFYTIDARGLNKGSASSSIIDQKVAFDNAGPASHFDMQEDGTNALAVDTGGIAIRNENNIGTALGEIRQDAATYYVIGYTPSNQTFDGKFRKIDVAVKRPDLKVRARRGYLALEPAKLLKPIPITPAPDAPEKSASEPVRNVESPVPATPAPAAPSAAEVLRSAIDAHGLVQELRKSGESAERIAPTKANDLAGKGWDAYSRGDLEHAAVYLGQAAEAPDARPWVRYALGLADLALAKYPAAVANWEHVRRDVPEFEPVYFNLADGYMLQRDDDSALKVLRDAQGRWPNDSDVWNASGVLEIRRRSIDAAITAFTRATTVASGESLGFFNLAKAYQMRAAQSQRFDSSM